MVIESKDIQSDLRALRKLYGLIRNNGEETRNNGEETTNTDLLDEHSRLVLKNLLDAATKKVLLKLQSENETSGTQDQSASRSSLSVAADTDRESVAADTDGSDASLLKEKGEQSFRIVPASESHKLCQSKNECVGYDLENSKCSFDVDGHLRDGSEAIKQIDLCISGLNIEREGADHLFDNNSAQPCRLLCHVPTQRATDPMFLLFQPAKAVMLGRSTCNCIRSGPSFSPAPRMESLYQGHTAIEDEQRHLQTYKQSSRMNMINSENGDQESDEEASRSNSEEYSSTDESREAENVNLSRSSGSWGTPSGYSSNSDEEVYSSSSRDETPQLTFSSSSSRTSEGYSSFEETTHRIHGYAKRSGPKACGVNHVKQSGIWSRLKERLSVIFHHRHHDHGDRRKMIRRDTLDKHKEKVVNVKRRDETHWKKAVEKTRKPLVHQKRQHSHFHGLVEGLLRHVRQSKQVKTGKGNVAKHNRKKNSNKSHWWKLLQHHRGAQLHHHRKIGLGKEKGH